MINALVHYYGIKTFVFVLLVASTATAIFSLQAFGCDNETAVAAAAEI